jgi:leader peptidase (prepilin peptidase) / N-methyltransferase
LTIPLVIVGVVGLFVGLVIDRAIRRLPLEKSMLFPWGEYCERCLQRKPLVASIPIVGLLFVGGRCPSCGVTFSKRGILIQLLTAAGFMGIYYLHIGLRGRELPSISQLYWNYQFNRLFALVVFHCILYSLLLAATFTDLDYTLIPAPITNWGIAIAIILGTFWYIELRPIPVGIVGGSSKAVYLAVHPGQWFEPERWNEWFGGKIRTTPPWMEWFRSTFYLHWALNWTKYLGFVTGVVGFLIGYGIIWIVRLVCSWAFGKEAMGIGDLWLLGMIGTFLGWQTAVIAFILLWVSGVVIGLPVALFNRGQAMPLGPHIAIGAVAAVVFWRPLWTYFEPVLFDAQVFFMVAIGMALALGAVAWAVQIVKGLATRTWAAAAKG